MNQPSTGQRGDVLDETAKAWLDARTDPLVKAQDPKFLLELGDELAELALLATQEIDKLTVANNQLSEESCPDPEQHIWEHSGQLPALVRDEHDHNHNEPWSICGYAICREAIREGQS